MNSTKCRAVVNGDLEVAAVLLSSTNSVQKSSKKQNFENRKDDNCQRTSEEENKSNDDQILGNYHTLNLSNDHQSFINGSSNDISINNDPTRRHVGEDIDLRHHTPPLSIPTIQGEFSEVREVWKFPSNGIIEETDLSDSDISSSLLEPFDGDVSFVTQTSLADDTHPRPTIVKERDKTNRFIIPLLELDLVKKGMQLNDNKRRKVGSNFERTGMDVRTDVPLAEESEGHRMNSVHSPWIDRTDGIDRSEKEVANGLHESNQRFSTTQHRRDIQNASIQLFNRFRSKTRPPLPPAGRKRLLDRIIGTFDRQDKQKQSGQNNADNSKRSVEGIRSKENGLADSPHAHPEVHSEAHSEAHSKSRTGASSPSRSLMSSIAPLVVASLRYRGRYVRQSSPDLFETANEETSNLPILCETSRLAELHEEGSRKSLNDDNFTAGGRRESNHDNFTDRRPESHRNQANDGIQYQFTFISPNSRGSSSLPFPVPTSDPSPSLPPDPLNSLLPKSSHAVDFSPPRSSWPFQSKYRFGRRQSNRPSFDDSGPRRKTLNESSRRDSQKSSSRGPLHPELTVQSWLQESLSRRCLVDRGSPPKQISRQSRRMRTMMPSSVKSVLSMLATDLKSEETVKEEVSETGMSDDHNVRWVINCPVNDVDDTSVGRLRIAMC